MSGHNKWSKIKNSKGKADSERSNMFTKLSREILVAVKEGGAEVESNYRLKMAIAKARECNMPNDKINGIIKRTSSQDASNFERQTYEGYGVGGVAVIVECLTDNKNRTASDVRYAFDKFGGSLGSNGCVSYLFDKKGVIVIEKDDKFDSEKAIEIALENDADDFQDYDDVMEIYSAPTDSIVANLQKAIEDAGYNVVSAEISLIPQNYISLTDSQRETFEKMLSKLDESDDVQQVIHNLQEDN